MIWAYKLLPTYKVHMSTQKLSDLPWTKMKEENGCPLRTGEELPWTWTSKNIQKGRWQMLPGSSFLLMGLWGHHILHSQAFHLESLTFSLCPSVTVVLQCGVFGMLLSALKYPPVLLPSSFFMLTVLKTPQVSWKHITSAMKLFYLTRGKTSISSLESFFPPVLLFWILSILISISSFSKKMRGFSYCFKSAFEFNIYSCSFI